jgi:GDP-L-fucose synthase
MEQTMSFWAGKRVMVTGGTGFLGSHVVEKLRPLGCAAVFVVRHRDYDLMREEQVARLFREHPADIVIHLAGLVGGIGANQAQPADFFYRNLLINTFTLHYAWKAGAQKVVAAAAGCGYPEHAPMPLKEANFWDGFPQQESAPYSLAKRMIHVQALAYWRQHRFPIITAIPGNIYGPYDNFDLENAHVIPALVRKFVEAIEENRDQLVVWGSGRPTRDFLYGGDAADGLLLAAEVYDQPELVNLSSGRDTSIREVIETLTDVTGFKGEIVWDRSKPDGQSRRLFDMSKAQQDLGWTASMTLREGLAETVAWYRAHRGTARNLEPVATGGSR